MTLVDDIKGRIDLLTYIGQYVQMKPAGRLHKGLCPFHSEKTPSFVVDPERGAWRCYGACATGGDVIEFARKYHSWSFTEALKALGGHTSGKSAPSVRLATGKATVANEPPPADLQNTFRQILHEAQNYLWSGRPDAQQALDYLLQERHLREEQIRQFGLGFNPKWKSFGKGGGKLAPGIVIPVESAGALWALRVRLLSPELIARYEAKYLSARGSSLLGSMFNGDAIQPGQTVIICEGEFDALLAGQELESSVITLGAAGNKLSTRWREKLLECSQIYIIPDNDTAGGAAADDLLAALPGALVLKLPEGAKDITEFVQQGGNLKAWFDGETRFCWWPGGMPDTWRSALYQTDAPASIVLVADLLNEAMLAGLINGKGFTFNQVKAASVMLGWKVADNTLRSAIEVLAENLFLQKLETGKTHPDSVSNFEKNTHSGRKAIFWEALPLKDCQSNLLAWAHPRIVERWHPARGCQAILAEFAAGMIDAAQPGIREASDQVAVEINRRLAPKRSHLPKRSIVAEREFVRLEASLKDFRSSHLPTAFPKSTPSEYRAAFAHAYAKSREGDFQMSRANWSRILGVSNGTLGSTLERAGLGVHRQFASLEIKTPEDIPTQVQNAAYQFKGRPLYLIEQLPSRPAAKRAYDPLEAPKVIAHAIAAGGEAKIEFQVANRYQIVSDEPVKVFASPPARRQPTTPARSVTSETTIELVKPHYGPTYNPAWVAAQLRLALHILGWVLHEGRLVNPSTGESANPDSPREMIEAIIARPLDVRQRYTPPGEGWRAGAEPRHMTKFERRTA